ncbi:GNAT family N-acetyltransferase [Candidatus Roizmanbacteria bacterium]|nr:GNAT family N-acetyltransferase [Candidatus Roizmanbacteria bacterium]
MNSIQFKPLQTSDTGLLQKWMNVDFVTRWYEKRKFVYDDVEKKLGNQVQGTLPVDSYIVYYHSEPVGYIHTYKISHYPGYASCVQVKEDSAGLDMFIGEKDYLHKGLGKDIVQLFLQEVVFKKDGIEHCIVGPEPEHKAAIRVFEKAGFRYLKTVQCTGAKDPEYLMVIDKHGEYVVFKR